MNKFSNLYKSTKLSTDRNLYLYFPKFMARNALIIAIPVLFCFHPSLEILLAQVVQLLYLGHYMQMKPHSDKLHAWIESFNESMVLIYIMLCLGY